MRMMIWAAAVVAAVDLGAATIASGTWSIDPERSRVEFTVTKFGREVVEGRFREFGGAVVYDARNPDRSSIRLNVRAAAVATGHPVRDRALLGSAFFDVDRFPEVTFVSNRVRPLPDGRIHITGVMTIRGARRPLVVTARRVGGDAGEPVFESQFVLNRHDFGVSGGSVTHHAISDKVTVQLRLAGVKR